MAWLYWAFPATNLESKSQEKTQRFFQGSSKYLPKAQYEVSFPVSEALQILQTSRKRGDSQVWGTCKRILIDENLTRPVQSLFVPIHSALDEWMDGGEIGDQLFLRQKGEETD